RGGLFWHPMWILIPGHPRDKWRARSHRGGESGVWGQGSPGGILSWVWRWGCPRCDPLGHVKGRSHSAEVCRAEQSQGTSCHLSVVHSVSVVCPVWCVFCLNPSRGLLEMPSFILNISLFRVLIS
ncbi:hypothetical protein HGM15179_021299, partial [Zosterops borbonicus]